VIDVEVIEDGAAAAVALDPIRSRLLGELREPGSAAELARRIGLARQKVNYHLRALEAHGLVEVAEERRHGGLTERVLQATAASYVIAPIGDPMRAADRLSARYLIALAARIAREVGALTRRDQRLRTLALDAEVRVTDRAAFADALTQAVTRVVSDHHDEAGEPYRLLVAAHPKEDA
jgi:DNA-binding transcriptional ArsR family regulator